MRLPGPPSRSGEGREWLHNPTEEAETILGKTRGLWRRSWAHSSEPSGLTWEKVTWGWDHTGTLFSRMGIQKTTLMGSFFLPRLLNCMMGEGWVSGLWLFHPHQQLESGFPLPNIRGVLGRGPGLNKASQTQAPCLLMLSER